MPRKPRPITSQQSQECAAFVRELRRTGNVTMAAEAVGPRKSTFVRRRRRFPDFAASWDAALAFARARLGKRGVASPDADGGEITQGGEFAVRYRQNGVLQVRRACPGELSASGERAFLAHLAATANISLSAEAVGVSVQAIYRRRRSAVFERELLVALKAGYDAIELTLLDHAMRSLDPEGHDSTAWEKGVDAVAPAWERMTPGQVLMLLGMHRRTVRHDERRIAPNAKQPSSAEVDAVLEKHLRRIELRRARDAARE